MQRIPQLPPWNLTNPLPAFHDYESLSAIDQTARLYGAMRGLIDDYNKFANSVNETIINYHNDLNADQEQFKNEINQLVHDYIIALDAKIAHQDRVIEENITYIKENLSTAVEDVITQMQESGELAEAIGDSFNALGERIQTLEAGVAELNNFKANAETRFQTLETKTAGLETKTNQNDEKTAEIENRTMYDAVNIKSLGAKGDGVTDDTQVFQRACAVANSVIIIPEGTYLISSFIPLAKNVKIIGNNATIKTEITDINMFGVNHYNDISGLKFELPYGFSGNVFEISYATLDNDSTVNHDLNIHISKIDFFFDIAINELAHKKGSAFLIYADSTIANNKFQSDGFFGIYLKDIFVKGACESVIKQYANKTEGDWITGCYYENFNINSAPFYGFLGTKDSTNLSDNTIWDGEQIYFINWQMQAGNSKNMFFFSWGHKTLKNIMPWDWQYAVSTDYKPINFLYRESSERRLSYIDKVIGNMWDIIQIENIPSESEYWAYVPYILNHYINKGASLLATGEYNRGKAIKVANNIDQTITKGKINIIKFPVKLFNDSTSVGFYHENNTIKIGKGVHKILLKVKLNFWLGYDNETINYYVIRNNEIESITGDRIVNGSVRNHKEYLEITEIIDVKEGDELQIGLYNANYDFTLSALGKGYNDFAVVALS